MGWKMGGIRTGMTEAESQLHEHNFVGWLSKAVSASSSVQAIQDEHQLCDFDDVPHIFIYTTDLLLSPEVEDEVEEEMKDEEKGKRRKVKRKLRDNEVVIHCGNKQQFYSSLMTFIKACCVDVGIATQMKAEYEKQGED